MAFVGFFGLLFCFQGYNIQRRINFTRKLAIFINFLKLIPTQDTSCLREALSLICLADIYSENYKLL